MTEPPSTPPGTPSGAPTPPPFFRIGPERPVSPVILSIPHAGRDYGAPLLKASRLPQGGAGDARGPAGRPAGLARDRERRDRLHRPRAARRDRPQPRRARDRSGADRAALAAGEPGPVGAHAGRARPHSVAHRRRRADLARADSARRARSPDRNHPPPLSRGARSRARPCPRPLRRGDIARLPFDAAAAAAPERRRPDRGDRVRRPARHDDRRPICSMPR